MWADNACYWCFCCKKRSRRQRRDVKEPNPMLQVSESTRLGQSHHAAWNWSTVYWAKQLIYAWQGRPPGGICHCIPCRWMKSQLLKFLVVVASQRIDCPAESRMIVSWAAIFCPLMPGGCIKSSQCQWWSRLFSIGQLVWEEDGSLSKTTKLLLLDSLLQEVCIESGSDGSLALSSLGLSVCLVSHNLLYSGLKKAHSTLKS